MKQTWYGSQHTPKDTVTKENIFTTYVLSKDQDGEFANAEDTGEDNDEVGEE